MNIGASVVAWILLLSVALLVFLAAREIVCWYFKLTRIVELLESINARVK